MDNHVPLNRLVLSDLNARKTYADEDIAGLADNIHERGLHQNLVVSKSPTRRGYHEVDAGGRRWRALKRNVELARLDPAWPVPVKIVPREEAAEASLDENIQKIALNPADELVAYATIIAGYEADGISDRAERIAQCARRRGVPVRHVEQRLRLAALHPDILEALRTAAIPLEAARAYAAHPDQELQLKVFVAEEGRPRPHGLEAHSPAAIRNAIRRRIYPADHKAVLYVGLQAYTDAGGRTDVDLFMGADAREALIDPDILDRLVAGKAQADADFMAKRAGWAGGAVRPWQTEGWAEPPGRPKGMRARAVSLIPDDARRECVLWYQLAADGSGLDPWDFAFAPDLVSDAGGGTPASGPGGEAGAGGSSPAGAARPRGTSVDTRHEWDLRERKLTVDVAAARLAVPSFEGTPFEGRAFWPNTLYGINALSQAEDGDLVVALLIKVPAADVAARRDEAEWQLAEEAARSGAPPEEDPEPVATDPAVAVLQVEGAVS